MGVTWAGDNSCALLLAIVVESVLIPLADATHHRL